LTLSATETANEHSEAYREPTKVEKLRGLPWSIAFDIANTFAIQFTFFGSIFVLFLNDLGLNNSQIGFLLSTFPFFGLVAPFITPQVARLGYKRTFITFFGLRNLVAGLLLLTPLVVARFDARVVLIFVSIVTMGYALCRAIGMTGLLPWQQEYIPNEIRGKYSAFSNIFTSLSGLLAVAVASSIVGRFSGLSPYILLIGLGVIFGLISTYLITFVPGGKPAAVEPSVLERWQEMQRPVRDHRFALFLIGFGLVTLATSPMFSFLPLFMQSDVGLSTASVVWLQTGNMVGSLVSSFLWGWMADRYGSKPVMVSGLLLMLTLPVWWILMPRHSNLSLAVALTIAVLQGIATIGWTIGSGRLMYVSIIPTEWKSSYLALYNAWTGLVGGISPLIGGWMLDRFSGQTWDLGGLQVGSYTLLFTVGFVLLVLAGLALRAVHTESDLSVGKFAGLFLHGNPILAVESLIRYHFAREELSAVTVTERLGQARSPLTVDELLDALADPRFYVRFEAIVSIARHSPDDRLVQALIEVLNGKDPALGVIAAWALGRMGHPQALAPLRASLQSPYRSIKAHAARSLATLGDQDSKPLLLQLIQEETDPGLLIAYASALGKLQCREAVPVLLDLLAAEENPGSREELALALARLVGDEGPYIQLLRSCRQDPGTALSQALSPYFKRVHSSSNNPAEDETLVRSCAHTFALGELDQGALLLASLIETLPPENYPEHCMQILKACKAQYCRQKAQRLEYVVLGLYTLQHGYRPAHEVH
jgi:MFS family permease